MLRCRDFDGALVERFDRPIAIGPIDKRVYGSPFGGQRVQIPVFDIPRGEMGKRDQVPENHHDQKLRHPAPPSYIDMDRRIRGCPSRTSDRRTYVG